MATLADAPMRLAPAQTGPSTAAARKEIVELVRQAGCRRPIDGRGLAACLRRGPWILGQLASASETEPEVRLIVFATTLADAHARASRMRRKRVS